MRGSGGRMAGGLIGWGGRRGVFYMEMEREGRKGREQARHDTTWHGMAWHGTNSAPAFWMFSTNGWERSARDLESDAPAGRSDYVICYLQQSVNSETQRLGPTIRFGKKEVIHCQNYTGAQCLPTRFAPSVRSYTTWRDITTLIGNNTIQLRQPAQPNLHEFIEPKTPPR